MLFFLLSFATECHGNTVVTNFTQKQISPMFDVAETVRMIGGD